MSPRRFSAGTSGSFRGQAAFTLIEIMIVAGLIAIFMSIGLPSFFQAMKKNAIRQAVSDVMDACKEARASAILHSTPAEVVFSARDGSISVRMGAGSSVGAGAHVNDSGAGGSSFSKGLSDDIAFELLDINFVNHMQAEEAHVHFFPNGTSDEFTVVLRSLQGEFRKISLNPITGRAEMEVIR
jgi:prepilin-type N-terminal cleavage/methylation domain-containing protein